MRRIQRELHAIGVRSRFRQLVAKRSERGGRAGQ
jgi:hypothetical protein